MLGFFKKKIDVSTLEERIEKVENTLRLLKTQVLDAQTDIDAVRDKVLRKIQKPREEPEELNSSKGGLLYGYNPIREGKQGQTERISFQSKGKS